MATAVIPNTIIIVDVNLIAIDPLEVSSPSAPVHILAITVLYNTVNNALTPPTAETRAAGRGGCGGTGKANA